MNRLYQRLNVLFSGKYAGPFILGLCIVSKVVLIFFYSYIGRDKMYHLSASYNLLHGKGWTNSFYYTSQLDKEMLEPFCLWPPGYGLMVAPLEYISGDDLHLSTTILEIIFFIAFILLCRAILITQGVSRQWLNISVLLLSFYPYEFIEKSLGTDLPGVCFVLGFFYCSIRLWQPGSRRTSLLLGAAAGLCLFMAGFTRYMYVPVSLFMAIFMLLAAYWKSNKVSLHGYWVCLFICVAGLAIATIYQAAACGNPFYVGTGKNALCPENLQYWYPAALAAFLNVNIYPTLLEWFTDVQYISWKKVFGWINLVVYGALLISAARCLPFLKKTKANDFPVFEVVGFVLSAATIGELAMLSLTHTPQYSMSGKSWTYIWEGRYQAFPIVFLQLLFWSKIAKAGGLLAVKNIRSYCMTGLFALLCLNSLHEVYFTAKVMLNYQDMKRNQQREWDYVFAESYLKQTIRENPDKEVLITSPNACFPLMASIYGAKGVKDYANLSSISSLVSKPTIVLALIYPEQLDQYKAFTGRKDVKLIKVVNGTYIYRQDLK